MAGQTAPLPAAEGAAPDPERVAVLHARIVSGRGGGPEKTILNSPRQLAGTRWSERALYLHAPGDEGIAELRARAAERGCPFTALAERLPFDLACLWRIAALCREQHIRIWHGHDYKSNLYGLLLAPLLSLRLVTTVHGWVQHTARTPLYFAVDRWCLRRYERVVAVSADLHAECLRAGVPPGRLSLIENGIDATEFRRTGPPAAAPLREGLPPGRLLVLAAGRLSDEKGFDLLIEALRLALLRGADLALWIAGEGAERARLERQIATAGLEERVRLLGWRADLQALLEAADLFALSSLREGLPNVVLEALALELPLLATKSGGIDAAFRDGEEALLVPPGDAQALARGLERLASDATLRARLARTGRARIERDFSFAARMQRFAALYEQLLAAPRSR